MIIKAQSCAEFKELALKTAKPFSTSAGVEPIGRGVSRYHLQQKERF